MLAGLRERWKRLKRYRPLRVAGVGFNRALQPRGKRHVGVLLAGLLTVIVWQASFATLHAKLDESFRIRASSGVHQDSTFVYFLYYLDLFPVVSLVNARCNDDKLAGCLDATWSPADYSEAAAKEALRTQGGKLVQDTGWTWNAGDRGKIYLYLFDAWMKGRPADPSPRPAGRLAFIIALCALWGSCWYIRRPVLGALLVLFLGSNPFQLFETHVNANVFSWPITAAILLLAGHLPLLRRWRPDPDLAFVWPIATALFVGSVRTIRSEPATMVLACGVTYLLITGFSWKRRLAMVAVLGVALFGTGQLWQRHFIRQHDHARAVLTQVGGHPFPGPLRLHHQIWHPIWCGLGDFGQKYGYQWNDHKAAAYAKPLMEAKGVFVPSGYFQESTDDREFYDKEHLYKKLPYDQPYYDDIIRAKVISDVKKDPGWYLGVLWNRAKRIMNMTTPVRVSWSTGHKDMPWMSALTVPLLALLALLRSRFLAGLVLFTFPGVTTAFVIFSDLGTTYYGVFHIIAFAVIVTAFVHHAWYWGKREVAKRRTARPEEAPT